MFAAVLAVAPSAATAEEPRRSSTIIVSVVRTAIRATRGTAAVARHSILEVRAIRAEDIREAAAVAAVIVAATRWDDKRF